MTRSTLIRALRAQGIDVVEEAGGLVCLPLAQWLASAGQPVDAVIGMLASKDARGFLEPLASHLASVVAVPIGGHDHVAPAQLAELARGLGIAECHAANSLEEALNKVPRRDGGTVLLGGSLYFAGQVLRANREFPL